MDERRNKQLRKMDMECPDRKIHFLDSVSVVSVMAVTFALVGTLWGEPTNTSGKTNAVNTKIISADMQSAQDFVGRGKASMKEEELALALADFSKAIEIDPKCVEAYSERSRLYMGLAAEGLYLGSTNLNVSQGNCDLALADSNKAIQLDPKNPDLYGPRGFILSLAGKWEQGLGDYQKAIELDHSTAKRYMDRAQFYCLGSANAKMIGNFKQSMAYDKSAECDYNEAVKLAPLDPGVRIDRAQFNFARNWDEALVDFKKAIELNPSSAFPHYLLATMHSVRGEDSLALAEYTKAIDLEPKNPVPYSYRGEYYANQGKYDLALVDLDKALELDPKKATAYATRAEINSGKGKFESALMDWSKAAEFTPKNIRYRQEKEKCELRISGAGK